MDVGGLEEGHMRQVDVAFEDDDFGFHTVANGIGSPPAVVCLSRSTTVYSATLSSR